MKEADEIDDITWFQMWVKAGKPQQFSTADAARLLNEERIADQ